MEPPKDHDSRGKESVPPILESSHDDPIGDAASPSHTSQDVRGDGIREDFPGEAPVIEGNVEMQASRNSNGLSIQSTNIDLSESRSTTARSDTSSTPSSPLSDLLSEDFPSDFELSPIQTQFPDSVRADLVSAGPGTTIESSSFSERPSRKRTVPQKLVEQELSRPLAKKISTAKSPKAPQRDVWNPAHLLQNPKSKLVRADLVGVFSDSRAWDGLNVEQRDSLLALLPESMSDIAGDGSRRIQPKFLKYDNNWRDGVRTFQENLESGRYHPSWLQQAADAMEARAHGDFDEYLAESFASVYGERPHKPDEINEAVDQLIQDRRVRGEDVEASKKDHGGT
ncbi:MAG: hypothetical protein M1837_006666 [Sclerophora amabilis]|nr:MAG: hypothetical protein M1837_006666 [Sclerophora amabilis]